MFIYELETKNYDSNFKPKGKRWSDFAYRCEETQNLGGLKGHKSNYDGVWKCLWKGYV